MAKHKSIILRGLFVWFFATGMAYAQKQMDMYECNSAEAINNCSTSSCKKTGISRSFLVNPINSTVISNYYLDSTNPTEMKALKSCNVIDKNNWVCETSTNYYPNIKGKYFDAMSQGAYRAKYEHYGDTRGNSMYDNKYYCAK